MTWIKCSDIEPAVFTDVLVAKYYLDHVFENGGYNVNKPIKTDTVIQIDSCVRHEPSLYPSWSLGGMATHWQPLPKPPEEE